MSDLTPAQWVALAVIMPPAAILYLCLLASWRRTLTRDDQPHGWEERHD